MKSKDLYQFTYLTANHQVSFLTFFFIILKNSIKTIKIIGTEICGFLRFRFLLQSLKDLEKQFKSFGFNFMCFYGEPHEILEKLISVCVFFF